MRRSLAVALLMLTAACERAEPPPLPAPAQTAYVQPWFICDGIDAPALFVFERDGDTVRVAQYDKPNGALIERSEYTIGEGEGAAGSVYTSLMLDGREAGQVREINAGMLETPAAAYTPVYSSVRFNERNVSCRWLPRTRLMGFTGRRTIVISEDQDGDLLYHSYDFAGAEAAQAIDLSENGRTTTFSLEVRDGAETTTPGGVRYSFQADVETEIEVTIDSAGIGRVTVRRHGPTPVQTEDIIAYVLGSGAD